MPDTVVKVLSVFMSGGSLAQNVSGTRAPANLSAHRRDGRREAGKVDAFDSGLVFLHGGSAAKDGRKDDDRSRGQGAGRFRFRLENIQHICYL